MLKDELLSLVYTPWHNRMTLRMHSIIEEQAKIYGEQLIRLRGRTYFVGGFSSEDVVAGARPPHPSLRQVSHAWLVDNEELDKEKRLAGGSIAAVLAESNNIEDYLDLFPSSLHAKCLEYEASLPPRGTTKRLTPERFQWIQSLHQPYLALLGQRQVLNLIL